MRFTLLLNSLFLVGGRARAEARIDPRPLRTSRSTAHGVRVSYTLDHMGRFDELSAAVDVRLCRSCESSNDLLPQQSTADAVHDSRVP